MKEELRIRLGSLKAMVDESLEGVLPPKGTDPSPLLEAMHDSLLGAGKRLRPILLMESAHLFHCQPQQVLSPATAVEILHCYSLVHDDLPCMDNDDLRRGRPTIHRVYGEDMAVLTGDALLTLAFEVMASSPFPPPLLLQIITAMAKAAGYRGLVGGQMEDQKAVGEKVHQERLKLIHDQKTGSLLNFAIYAGALIGKATKEEISYLHSFGESLGLLFQITDDILDVEGETGVMGKERGSDEGLNKATYPLIIGLQESKEMADSLAKKALRALKPFGTKAHYLQELTYYILERKA